MHSSFRRALLLVSCLAGLTTAAAAQPHPVDPKPALHVLPQPPFASGWGEIVEPLGDLDGDGAADFAAAGPGGGVVHVLSGRSGATLFSYQGFLDQLGRGLGGGGDLDGDGVPDFALGAPFGLPYSFVRAHSGADGSVLWTTTEYGWGLGMACDLVPDVNGDGFDDVVAGNPFFKLGDLFKVGRVQVLSGADGVVLHTLTGQFEDERFGETLASAGDVDGDGAGDYLIGSWRILSGKALLVSGATGETLHQWNGSAADCAVGSAVAGAGDVDADGVPDVVIGDDCHTTQAGAEGMARVYSGADGSLLYEFRGEQSKDYLGVSVSTAGDLDGDGHADVLVGALGIATDIPYARVYSGRDGHVLFRFAYDIHATWTEHGICVRAGGDLDGNESADVLIGMPSAVYGKGLVYAFGRGATSWEDVGGALSGAGGPPGLTGEGVLAAGEPATVALALAAPRAPVWVVAGSGLAQAPFLGGVLVPAPDLVHGPFATDGDGAWQIGVSWPTATSPGSTWTLQAWIADAGGPAGFAASNAISATVH